MKRTRRVGVLTLGITLIVFGCIFIYKTIFNRISYGFILKLWPCILIILGLEILISYICNKEEEYKYDGYSVLLLLVMSVFSMFMASMEFFYKNMDYLIH